MAHFYMKLVKRKYTTSENTYIALDRVSFDGLTFYKVPAKQSVLIVTHEKLFENTTVKNAANSITPLNGYRNIKIKLTDEIKELYTDQDDNVRFGESYWEEINELDTTNQSNQNLNFSTNETIFLQHLKDAAATKSELEQSKLFNVEKKFTLEKFNGTQNSKEWIVKFEKECERYNIKESSKMIEVMKFFLDGSAVDWYYANHHKLKVHEYQQWRKSLLLVYADKGWTTVRQALSFRYIGGSLTDYAIKKERLCLEAEKDSTDQSRINLIVYGLPSSVQEKLDKEEIKKVDELYTELRKLDDSVKKKQTNQDAKINKKDERTIERKKSTEQTSGSTALSSAKAKDPCFMCNTLGLVNPPRYHDPKVCNNKAKYAKKVLEVNCILARESNEGNSTSEIAQMMNIEPFETNSTNPKNA